MPASAPSPTTSQRAASSAPPAGVLPPAGGITCPSPQKTPTTRREILVALGEDARGPERGRPRPQRADRGNAAPKNLRAPSSLLPAHEPQNTTIDYQRLAEVEVQRC